MLSFGPIGHSKELCSVFGNHAHNERPQIHDSTQMIAKKY